MDNNLCLDAETGWFDGVIHKPSPNFNKRPDNVQTSLLVIHCISLPKGQYQGDHIIDFFQNKLDVSKDASLKEIQDLKVSAHFLIRRDGKVIQFVSIYDRAWHAGISTFQGIQNCNDYSIGVELEGTDNSPYEMIQYDALAELTKILMSYTIITKKHIVAHSDISPGRKTDPGKYFDWAYYLRHI